MKRQRRRRSFRFASLLILSFPQTPPKPDPMGQKREREPDSNPPVENNARSELEPTSPPVTIPPDPEMMQKKQVNRCSGCRRKVGLIGFRCRCGDVFCWEHRYSDRHDCGFDYKAWGRAAIARENPVVRPTKILKV